MEELRKVLRDAVRALKKSINPNDPRQFQSFDHAYNQALEDVVGLVINKLPD